MELLGGFLFPYAGFRRQQSPNFFARPHPLSRAYSSFLFKSDSRKIVNSMEQTTRVFSQIDVQNSISESAKYFKTVTVEAAKNASKESPR